MLSRIFTNRLFQLAVMGCLLGGAIMIQVGDGPMLNRVRNIGFDYYNKLMPRRGESHDVIVDIDEESLKRYGQWPWPRTLVAKLTTAIKAAGAESIVYDITFAERDRTSPQVMADQLDKAGKLKNVAAQLRKLPDNDDVLAAAIADAGNVVTGFVGANRDTGDMPISKSHVGWEKDSIAFRNLGSWQAHYANSLPKLVDAAAGNGSFTVENDGDGLIRRVPMLMGVADNDNNKLFDMPQYPSLSLEALRVALGAHVLKVKDSGPPLYLIKKIVINYTDKEEHKKALEIPTDAEGKLIVYYAGKRREIYIPAWQVLEGGPVVEKIKGKIALVGTSSIGLLDLRASPLNPILPGVEIHAEIIDQILNQQFLNRTNETRVYETVVTMGAGIVIILLAPFIGSGMLALFSLTITGLGIAYGFYTYKHFGYMIDVIYPSMITITIFIIASIFSNLRSEMEKRMIRQAFSHYLSPVLIAELAKNPEKLRLGGEVRDLSVMFTDIRNFTTISESMEPAELIRMMNDFLTPMTSAVLDNRGTVDKYMGDAMMAFWNAPLDDRQHAQNACRTALLMVASLAPVNDNLRSRMEAAGKPFRELKAGIGINSGTASVGNMGSKQRFAYSALGDTVNLASRIEGQTKGYGISIMISDSVRKAAPQFAAIEIDLLTVKGRKEPERVHALLGGEDEAQSAEFIAFAKMHGDMLSAYRARQWDKAAEQADACATERPELFMLYKLYKELIIAYRENPPPENWGGIWVAKDK